MIRISLQCSLVRKTVMNIYLELGLERDVGVLVLVEKHCLFAKATNLENSCLAVSGNERTIYTANRSML